MTAVRIMTNERTKLVYSTGTTIPQKKEPKAASVQAGVLPASRKVIVRLDRKGRGGKSVSMIEGLPLPEREKEMLLKQLKAKFGTGGALKDGVLEIQGDHCVSIMQHLQGLGYRPKKSGG